MKDTTQINVTVINIEDDGIDIFRNMYKGFITRGRDAQMNIEAGVMTVDIAYDDRGIKKYSNGEFYLRFQLEPMARVIDKVVAPYYQIARLHDQVLSYDVTEITITMVETDVPF